MVRQRCRDDPGAGEGSPRKVRSDPGDDEEKGPDIGIYAFQERWFPSMYYEGVAEQICNHGHKPTDRRRPMYENFTGPVLAALARGLLRAGGRGGLRGDGRLEA